MTFRERKWLTAFQAGDPRAFDTLFAEYAGRLQAFARQLTGSRAEAEDLTQEVFVAAYRGAHRFRGQSSLLTWLFAIAVRQWRDRQRRPQAPLADYEELLFVESGASSPADQVVASLSLQAALQSLTPALRESFLLVASQGLTHRQAAQILERPLGTVKWQVAEATKRLRHALQPEEDQKDPEKENLLKDPNETTPKEAAHV